LETTLVAAQLADALELDELCSFVLKKANNRRVEVVLCHWTRRIVADFIADRLTNARSAVNCGRFFAINRVRRPPNYLTVSE
jgi:hypothetical protein